MTVWLKAKGTVKYVHVKLSIIIYKAHDFKFKCKNKGWQKARPIAVPSRILHR